MTEKQAPKSQTTQHTKPYSSEFKESAVKLAVESDKPSSEIARELGINVNTLYTWIDKYSTNSESTLSKNEHHITSLCTIFYVLP